MYITSPFRQAQRVCSPPLALTRYPSTTLRPRTPSPAPWWRAIWPAAQYGTKLEISANRDMSPMLRSHLRAPAAGFLDAYPSCGTRAPECTEPGFKQMLACAREELRLGLRVSWALMPSPLALNRQASSSGWVGDVPFKARGEPPGPLEDRSTMDILATLSGALTPASEVSHSLISSPPALNGLALSFFRYAEFALKNVRDSMICLPAAYQEMTESILPGAWAPKPADSSPPAA
ncbi:hypothetical protein LTS02_007194 [Friedmanniomyces endolithicus]|nr:hypothetical protein LTS02_007194 [Friedmanniomyces endolithicus]